MRARPRMNIPAGRFDLLSSGGPSGATILSGVTGGNGFIESINLVVNLADIAGVLEPVCPKPVSCALMARMPGTTLLDQSAALLLDPYGFISKRCARYDSDVFKTRLLLRPTICMRGRAAAQLFYDNERFMRGGAAPMRLQKTLFGVGGVQGLDGAAHSARKAMFVSLLGSGRVPEIAGHATEEWEAALRRWPQQARVVLYRESALLLCRAICRWAGVPLDDVDLPGRTADFLALIEGAGAIGPRHWKARWARRRLERWIADVVARVREGRLQAPNASALATIATFTEPNGDMLDERIAAVELINVLRPTVAVAVLVAQCGLALFEHPACRQPLCEVPEYSEWFVHEVRRYYPFFPFVAARVRKQFDWRGYQFPEGRRVMLDLYGTGRDLRTWPDADVFRPERFSSGAPDPFAYIPQGGGDQLRDHRCPGEWLTIELAKIAADFLACRLRYKVPAQNLALRRMPLPAIPASGFVIAVSGQKPRQRSRRPDKQPATVEHVG
jgi:fatty-acid peroxygenase